MDANTKRPWYRLHWGTWLVTILLAATIAWMHVRWFPSFVGWPLVYLDPFDYDRIPAWILLVNGVVGCLTLLATAYAVETAIRLRLQFQIRTLMFVTGTVALLLLTWRTTFDFFDVLDTPPQWEWGSGDTLGGVTVDPLLRFHAMANWPVRLPLIFGLSCVIYLTLRAPFWFLSRLRRAAPAKAAADGSPAP